jgi:hypothetical protein
VAITAPFTDAPAKEAELPMVTTPEVVETVLMPTVPEPLASTVKFSFVPVEVVPTATPPAAAAPTTVTPVTAEAVAAFTLKMGLVAPVGPTAKALAPAEVIVPTRAVTTDPPMVVLAGKATVEAPEKSTGLLVFKPSCFTTAS